MLNNMDLSSLWSNCSPNSDIASNLSYVHTHKLVVEECWYFQFEFAYPWGISYSSDNRNSSAVNPICLNGRSGILLNPSCSHLKGVTWRAGSSRLLPWYRQNTAWFGCEVGNGIFANANVPTQLLPNCHVCDRSLVVDTVTTRPWQSGTGGFCSSPALSGAQNRALLSKAWEEN